MADLITKLNYIKQTKNLIKQALIDQGQEVSSDTPFRDYVPTIEEMPVGAKLFNTIQEMNNSINNKHEELAIVYGEELTSITAESAFSSCIFPETVIFDEAISSNFDASFESTGSEWFDGWCSLSSLSFNFTGYGDTDIDITYTSEDGLTYIRTDNLGNPVNFGTSIKYQDYGDPLSENITKFMLLAGMAFNGLYKYDAYNEDKSKIILPKIDSVDIFNETTISDEASYDLIYNNNPLIMNWSEIAQKEALIHDTLLKGVTYAILSFYKDTLGNYIFLTWVNDSSTISNWTPVNGYPYYTFDINGAIKTTYSMYDNWYVLYAKIDSNNNITYTLVDNPTTYTVNLDSGSSYQMYNYAIPEAMFLPRIIKRDSSTGEILGVVDKDNLQIGLVKNGIQYINGSIRNEINKPISNFGFDPIYKIAENQFNLTNTNQLDTDVTAYGKTGILTGDGSLYSNLQSEGVLNNLFELSLIDSNTKLYGKVNDSYSNITTNNKPTYLKENVNGNKIFGKVLEQKQLPYLDTNGRQIYISKINGNYIARYHNGNTYTYALFDKNDNMLQEINLLALCGKDDFVYYITTTNLYKIEISTGIITDLGTLNIISGDWTRYNMKAIKDRYIDIDCERRGYNTFRHFVYDIIENRILTIYEIENISSSYNKCTIIQCENNVYYRYLTSSSTANVKKLDLSTGDLTTIVTGASATLSISDLSSDFYASGYEDNDYVYTKSYSTSNTSSNFIILDKTNGSMTAPGYVTLNNERMDAKYRFYRSIKDNKLYLIRVLDSNILYTFNKLILIDNITKNGNNLNINGNEIETPKMLPLLTSNNTYSFTDNRNFDIITIEDNVIEFETHYYMYMKAKCKIYSESNINNYNVIAINTSAIDPIVNYSNWTAIQNNSLQLGGDFGITQIQVDQANAIADNIIGTE